MDCAILFCNHLSSFRSLPAKLADDANGRNLLEELKAEHLRQYLRFSSYFGNSLAAPTARTLVEKKPTPRTVTLGADGIESQMTVGRFLNEINYLIIVVGNLGECLE